MQMKKILNEWRQFVKEERGLSLASAIRILVPDFAKDAEVQAVYKDTEKFLTLVMEKGKRRRDTLKALRPLAHPDKCAACNITLSSDDPANDEAKEKFKEKLNAFCTDYSAEVNGMYKEVKAAYEKVQDEYNKIVGKKP